MSPHWQTIILPCFLEFAEKEGTVPGDLHILLQQYYPVLFLFARDHLSISEGLGNEESIDWFVKARLAEIENIVCQTKAIFMPTLSDCSPNPSPTSDARQQLCGSNTELDQDSYSAKGSTHLISTKDQSLVMEMVDAMEDDSDTYDSESVLPYRKWRNMTRENYYDLALRITEKIDKMHNNEHDICQGLSRQKRIESLLVLMKKSKGSVYKMAELPFYEKCVEDPRKMEKIYAQNLKKRKRQPLEGEMAAESQEHFQAGSSNSEKSYPDTCYASGYPKLLNAASGSDFDTPPGTYDWRVFGHQSSTRQNQSFSQTPFAPAHPVPMSHEAVEIFSPTDSINHDYEERTQKRGVNSLETLNINDNTLLPLENRLGTSEIHQHPLSANQLSEELCDIGLWMINPEFSFPSESP